MKRRLISFLLILAMLLPMLPTSAFATEDANGRPTDLANRVFLALYLGGTEFPGEPTTHASSGYMCLDGSFRKCDATVTFASSAEGILEPSILNDVVQGQNNVWGVFSTTGGSRYLLESSGLVTGEDGSVDKKHNPVNEEKIIQAAIDSNNFTLPAGESIDDYTIVWYVVKYQPRDTAWHIDGLITKKATYSVNYYGNGNTSGGAPSGTGGLKSGESYTVLGNTGNLKKVVGGDTYVFKGWNTNEDGTGTHYKAGDVIVIDDANVTLYAEWYLKNKYSATVVTKLDGYERNIEDILGYDAPLYIQYESEGLIPLEKGAAGTYSALVTENGAYSVWFEDENGVEQKVEGYQITIRDQNGRTEIPYYSVSYDANADEDTVTWSGGAAPETSVYLYDTAVTDAGNVPAREGYTFLYWQDQDGNRIEPGQRVTERIVKKTTLTAQWQKNIDVTINVSVDHSSGENINTAENREDVLVRLLRDGLPLDQYSFDESHVSYTYDEENHITGYTLTLTNVPKGVYTAACVKSGYNAVVTRTGEAGQNQVIDIDLQYTPDNYDLTFDVVVPFENAGEQSLLPKAVNVKVSFWGYDENGELGWHVIGQQTGDAAPVTVTVDPETGKGTGFFPVPGYWYDAELDANQAYEYRVEVVSFVMPNGRVVPASGDGVNYTTDGTGLYTAEVTVEGEGRTPTRPGPDTLEGAYINEGTQMGIPTVTVDIHPYTVTFDATADGKINGAQEKVLQYQYFYPNLELYNPEPNNSAHIFAGWYYEDGTPAKNLAGRYLTEDVRYVARYSPPMTVEGNITVEGSFDLDGLLNVPVNPGDRAETVTVVLQKKAGDTFVDYASAERAVSYPAAGEDGTSAYRFENVPNDGSEYRVVVLVGNYTITYDNESDVEIVYAPEKNAALLGDDTVAQVHAHLDFDPKSYEQQMEVDASQIAESYRPDSVLAQVLARDMGDIYPYAPIAQHTVDPFGVNMELSDEALGYGSYNVWQYHTNGAPYEFQMDVTTIYGNVAGVFSPEGTAYDKDTAPYEVIYGAPSRYSAAAAGQARTLKATLVPKGYEIIFDMGDAAVDTIEGMDHYITDSETGEHYYSYLHKWSFGDQITAFPFRAGYVFEGWESSHEGVVVGKDGGSITVAEGLAEDVTLTAKWRKLEGTAYVVRHLELSTDVPLAGAQVFEGSAAGTQIKAVDAVIPIGGYTYAGAKIGDRLYSLNESPVLSVTNDPSNNVLILYYLKDGYSDQVESNLKMGKTAILENNGTYTINLETYTTDNPITTMVRKDTPLDIVLVLDQSGSIILSGYLDDLQAALNNFVQRVADHGRQNGVDHRIALVGYAGDYDEPPSSTDTNKHPIAGGNTSNWVNTGVFDSNGDFHPYDVTGFNYTAYSGSVEKDGVYYTYSEGEYLLLTHHDEYYHLVDEAAAKQAVLNGETVYGYVYDSSNIGSFQALTRNASGLWLYGDRELYSDTRFFTYHTDVWTHRKDLDVRQIHAYGTGANFKCSDGHDSLFTRTETKNENPELDVYADALIPVSVEAGGAGGTNPNLIKATQTLGSNGGTFVQYGVKMANRIFEANPLDPEEGRVRIMVTFTDGLPGIGTFDANVANEAIAEAYITKNTHDALSYTIALYPGESVDKLSDESIYMNALSSNYPDAKNMDDIVETVEESYVIAPDGTVMENGGEYYVLYDGDYIKLSYGRVRVNGSYQTCWYYTTRSWFSSTNHMVSNEANPVVQNGKVGGYDIYLKRPASTSYVETPHSGYYATTESERDLNDYFKFIVDDITTKTSTEVVLHEDTILRDIMGRGLVLTPGTVITAYKIPGHLNTATGQIEWAATRQQVAQLTLSDATQNVAYSPETTTVTYEMSDGTMVTKENVPYISVYNLQAQNPTNPDLADYHPHTVDITGYDFDEGYINESHPDGYKMVVEITRVEATEDVDWGRSTATNYETSGVWLPMDVTGKRELLLAFDQPTTIFIERAYVLDYGKEFAFSDWYLDVESGGAAVHADFEIANGMNWFDPENPNTANAVDGAYGNTTYGNVAVKPDGTVTYKPTTMNWGGYDQFYVFGNTNRKTVLAQDANENGNLWNKVTVIPANNVYYEDSFITTEGDGQNGIEGFIFTGAWSVEGEESGNVEHPEHVEDAPYGDVHGWTDSLGDDITYTDGSAHVTGLNGEMGAKAEFTFTGTGVEVYTRTNAKTGIVVAILSSRIKEEDGTETVKLYKSLAMDNLAVSGDYYHIPTVAFKDLPYGTYTLELIATAGDTATEETRYVYYIDGVRIMNPLGNTTNYQPDTVKDAYGMEVNAVFTEVRDVLLDYGDFNPELEDGTDGKMGAVFIDWIQEGQGTGNDPIGTGVPTYEVGTFETYGPKNEVYLSYGQAIVLKVDPANTYYVGLKSLTGTSVDANVSGIDDIATPTTITITHSTDMYYRIIPMNGYIVIQNNSSDGSILSITNLRTTNPDGPVTGGGILPVEKKEAEDVVEDFDQTLEENKNKPVEPAPQTPAQQQAEEHQKQVQVLFSSVRDWLETE